MAQHHGLQAGAAHLVDGHAAHGNGYTGLEGRLARRRLADTCRQYAAHDYLAGVAGFDAGMLDSGRDGGCAQVDGADIIELALE